MMVTEKTDLGLCSIRRRPPLPWGTTGVVATGTPSTCTMSCHFNSPQQTLSECPRCTRSAAAADLGDPPGLLPQAWHKTGSHHLSVLSHSVFVSPSICLTMVVISCACMQAWEEVHAHKDSEVAGWCWAAGSYRVAKHCERLTGQWRVWSEVHSHVHLSHILTMFLHTISRLDVSGNMKSSAPGLINKHTSRSICPCTTCGYDASHDSSHLF